MWLDDGDWIFRFLNGYVNFIDGSLMMVIGSFC